MKKSTFFVPALAIASTLTAQTSVAIYTPDICLTRQRTSIPITSTITGTTATWYQWQIKIGETIWQNIVGATSATFEAVEPGCYRLGIQDAALAEAASAELCVFVCEALPAEDIFIEGNIDPNGNAVIRFQIKNTVGDIAIEISKDGTHFFLLKDHISGTSYIDESISGASYYRLRVQTAAKIGYSNVVFVQSRKIGLNPLQPCTVQVYDVTGRQIFFEKLKSANTANSVQLGKIYISENPEICGGRMYILVISQFQKRVVVLKVSKM